MTSLQVTPTELDYLASPRAVRERSEQVFAKAQAGGTLFRLNLSKLVEASRLTLEVTRRNYPDLSKIPFHARWEHFQAGGHDRLSELNKRLEKLPADERVRSKLDLAVVSVLLDAGAGAAWSYHDGARGQYARSEGLALASLEMFCAGAFSSDPKSPYRADSKGLASLSADTLARGFQVDAHNPLLGLEGRLELLNRLGHALERRGEFFGASSPARVGNLLDHYRKRAAGGVLRASEVLKGLLLGFQDMWTPRTTLNGVSFGDLWSYELGGASPAENLVPFHKLSQWLSYSLIEPLIEGGLRVEGAEELTGLPEYRNGGLLLDTGVLELRDPAEAARLHAPGTPLIVEWRALTVTLLDRIGGLIRNELGLSEAELPLGKILQGGTWAAGRETAALLRRGLPPLNIESDGTVF
jgi:hypothetical protein